MVAGWLLRVGVRRSRARAPRTSRRVGLAVAGAEVVEGGGGGDGLACLGFDEAVAEQGQAERWSGRRSGGCCGGTSGPRPVVG